jgi:hypothetical protein
VLGAHLDRPDSLPLNLALGITIAVKFTGHIIEGAQLLPAAKCAIEINGLKLDMVSDGQYFPIIIYMKLVRSCGPAIQHQLLSCLAPPCLVQCYPLPAHTSLPRNFSYLRKLKHGSMILQLCIILQLQGYASWIKGLVAAKVYIDMAYGNV